jgi:hypothetical protein
MRTLIDGKHIVLGKNVVFGTEETTLCLQVDVSHQDQNCAFKVSK